VTTGLSQRRITVLRLVDFRNYSCFELLPSKDLTLLVGPNGVGKTNVIEAVSLVTRGESFRTTSWHDLVKWGAARARIAMTAEGNGAGKTDIVLEVAAGRRLYRVNDVIKRRVSDVAGNVPAVVFTPEDLTMVKGAADKRRTVLDSLGSQLSATYTSLRLEYDRITRQRNALLRAPETPEPELEPWTDRLVEVGARLRGQRTALMGRMRSEIQGVYAALTGGERLSLAYVIRDVESAAADETADTPTHDAIASQMRAALAQRAREERARGTSLVGPHRDDVLFVLEDRDARAFASQGQQRTIALAWKLAEVSLIEQTVAKTPVLLLDDVMSELDESRRRKLAVFVAQRTQTFVTTTNVGYFEPDFLSAAQVVELS
jgi:DNA replication and repair protein RecF